MNLGGYSQLYQIAQDVKTGKKSVPQGIQSLFAPGLLSLPLEAVTGQNLYTNKSIAQKGDFVDMVDAIGEGNFEDAKIYGARIGFDVTKDIMDKFAPINDIDRYVNKGLTPAEFWLGQVGVSVPTEDQQAGEATGGKIMRRNQKSAARNRPEGVE